MSSMFCQQCGSSIRSTARFCNMCGSEVKQRFASGTETLSRPVEPAKTRPNRNGSLSENSWPGAEETIIIPIVSGIPKKEVAAVKSAVAADEPAPRPKPPVQRPNPAAAKPFFTEVMPAIENRQHQRLVFVVPLLLVVFIILLVFAILVLPYIVAK